jgi:hypothetical protein
MTAVPGELPFTTLLEPTTTTVVLLLLHVPPTGLLLSVTEVPMHILEGPVMSVGDVLINTVVVVMQPAPVI